VKLDSILKVRQTVLIIVVLIFSVVMLACGGTATPSVSVTKSLSTRPPVTPTQPPVTLTSPPAVEQPTQPPMVPISPLVTEQPTQTPVTPISTPTVEQATPIPRPVETVNVTVKGTDAIYLAGRADIAIPTVGEEDAAFPLIRCGGDLQESFPPLVAVNPGDKFTFKVSGAIDYYGLDQPVGPDGSLENPGDIYNLGGISGYQGPNGALVGVFLSDANPSDEAAPDVLDFSPDGMGITFDILAPALGQVFFIGDGLTQADDGALQLFIAPPEATRLFLGIADAAGFVGEPGCYQDNVGSFQVEVSVSGPER